MQGGVNEAGTGALAAAFLLWTRYVSSPEFVTEVLSNSLHTDPIRSNFGPFYFNYQSFLQGVTRITMVHLTECVTAGIAGSSSFPLIRRCAFRFEYYPWLQQHYFSHLWTTRFLTWAAGRVTPKFVARLLAPGPFEPLDTWLFDPKQRTVSMKSAIEAHTQEGLSSPRISVAVRVLETHALYYFSAAALEQLDCIILHIRPSYVPRRTICKAQIQMAVSAGLEFVLGCGSRAAGAVLGSMLYPRDGIGAFYGEHILHAVLSRWICRTVQRATSGVTAAFDRRFPLTEEQQQRFESMRDEQSASEKEESEARSEILSIDSAVDLYGVLGVEEDATLAEVKKSYRALALKLHPDKVQALAKDEREAAAAEFKRVNFAYNILSNEQKRSDYDAVKRQRTAAAARSEGGGRWVSERFAALPTPLQFAAAAAVPALAVVGIGATSYLQTQIVYRMATAPGRGLVRMWL